jgi:hypothetical protein
MLQEDNKEYKMFEASGEIILLKSQTKGPPANFVTEKHLPRE